MGTYFVMRDKRLAGGVPARPNLQIANLDGSTPLSSAFGQLVATVKARGTVDSMFIMCHGFAGDNPSSDMSMDAGGKGLQLGRENLMHGNVGNWENIKGKVRHIVVYACAAGNTEPGAEGTTADGKYLMGALAIHTGARVYAADRIQYYHRYKGLSNGRYEFGDWEGQLWEFPPDGSSPVKRQKAPVEFADVMSGTAP